MRKPAVLTALFIAALLAVVLLRSSHSAPKTNNPTDAIYGMLDAARAADTNIYLDTFAGPLRSQIQQAVRETGKAPFASYLAAQSRAFQSVAVSVTDQPSDAEARVRVEYVYTNRNEVQTFHLKRNGARWAVIGISGTDQTKTLIPYGTSVTDNE